MGPVSRALLMVSGGAAEAPPGQIVYEGPTNGVSSNFSFVVPAGVTSISVVCVAAGCNAGGGSGGLAYGNNINVTAGETLTIIAAGGNQGAGVAVNSSLIRGGTTLVSAGVRGSANSGTALSGGGLGQAQPSAGAGGYTGNGGSNNQQPSGGAAGGGGIAAQKSQISSGYFHAAFNGYGGGGGVGLLGQGATGVNGVFSESPAGGSGGSGGGNGGAGGFSAFGSGPNAGTPGNGGAAGNYGGGGATQGRTSVFTDPEFVFIETRFGQHSGGARGAVRIIWAGNTRLFPSTNTGNL